MNCSNAFFTLFTFFTDFTFLKCIFHIFSNACSKCFFTFFTFFGKMWKNGKCIWKNVKKCSSKMWKNVKKYIEKPSWENCTLRSFIRFFIFLIRAKRHSEIRVRSLFKPKGPQRSEFDACSSCTAELMQSVTLLTFVRVILANGPCLNCEWSV